MTDYNQAITAYARRNTPDPGFLPNTPAAIKKFQRFHGLTPDGIVGPITQRVLNRLNTKLVSPQQLRQPAPTIPLKTYNA